MSDDLRERLLATTGRWNATVPIPVNPDGPEAAARIDTLTAQLDRAREALREWQGRLSDCINATERCGDADINVGRVQAYRLALSSSEQVAATLEQPHE